MSRVTIRGGHISGADTGIKAGPGVDLDVQGMTFDNVSRPLDIDPGARLTLGNSRVVNDPKLRAPDRRRTSSGWTRPQGPPLPSYCPSCRTVFPSGNYVFGGAYFRSWGNTEPCPKCGCPDAYLSEGIFDLSRDIVNVVSAPDMTHAMLQALTALAEAAINEEVSPAEVSKRLEAISPNLGDLAKRAAKLGIGVVSFVGAIAGIYAVYLGHMQVNIAREQIQLDRESAASDRALEETLRRYAELQAQFFEAKRTRAGNGPSDSIKG